MRKLSAKPGFAAVCAGLVILLHFLVIPLALTADQELVYFHGHALPETCSWRSVYGVPCPTCGMTRGVVLMMHGRVSDSFDVNRSAPVLVLAGLAVGFGLLGVGISRLRHRERAGAAFAVWTQRVGLVGASAWIAVLSVNWILVLRLVHRG